MAERPKTYKKKLTEGEKIVKLGKERHKRAVDAQSQENARYKHNIEFTYQPESQWPDEIRKQRKIDGRPCLTENLMYTAVNAVVNNYKMNTSGVKVLPAGEGSDKEVAEILTGIIRNIETQSNASQAKGYALSSAVAGNKGFIRVITEYADSSFIQQIRILPVVNPASVFYDCDSVSLDGSDFKWCFIEDSISKEEFESRYPDEDMTGWSSETSDWVQDDGKKVRICEYFYVEQTPCTLCLLDDGSVVDKEDLQEGMNVVDERQSERPIVRWCILGGNAKEPLEQKEWAGKYIPVVPVWGTQVWVNGKRELYSALEYSHSAQQMLNFWMSTEAELLAMQIKAKFLITPTQISGLESHWASANTSTLPYLLYNADNGAAPPQRQSYDAPPSGILQGAANARQAIRDTSGIQEASLGMQSNETSGRAINARTAQSDKASFQFLDNMNHADRYLGVILVDLIPRIMDTPQVVRTIGFDGHEAMKPINQEVKEKDANGNMVSKIYDLGTGQYDVIISSAPSFASLRQEGQQRISEVLQGNPQLMQSHGDLLFKSMDFPYAEELAERSKKMLPPGLAPQEDEEAPQLPIEVQQQMEQMQQQMQQMDQMLQQQAAELASKQAEYELKQQEIQIKQFDAETKRIQAMQRDSLPVQADVTIDPENDLSEADKLEISIAQALHMKQLEQEHDIKKTLLAHKLSKMAGDEHGEMDENGEVSVSPLVVGLQQNQEAIQQMSQAIANLTAINAAPKRVVRDENGNITGTEPVL